MPAQRIQNGPGDADGRDSCPLGEEYDPVAVLLELGTATLGESGADILAPRIQAVWPGACLAGPAMPVGCRPGDNLAVHVAIIRTEPGRVLMVDVG